MSNAVRGSHRFGAFGEWLREAAVDGWVGLLQLHRSGYGGVKAAFPERSVLQFSQSLCPPVFNVTEDTSPDCQAMNAFVFDRVKADHPDQILLVANWQAYDWRRLVRMVAALHEVGIRNVVIVGSLPYWGGRLPDLVARLVLRENRTAPPVRLVD